jgi:hypothetical protein
MTAEQVAYELVCNINDSSLQVTALLGMNLETITLINDNVGSLGNIVIFDTVANTDFITTGMSGGVDP